MDNADLLLFYIKVSKLSCYDINIIIIAPTLLETKTNAVNSFKDKITFVYEIGARQELRFLVSLRVYLRMAGTTWALCQIHIATI